MELEVVQVGVPEKATGRSHEGFVGPVLMETGSLA
jgi:hypothetical protein